MLTAFKEKCAKNNKKTLAKLKKLIYKAYS